MLRALRLHASIYCLLLLVIITACSKKSSEVTPPDPKPDEEVIPGETVGYGAEVLDPAEYEKIKIIAEPLIPGGRTQKDPKLAPQYDLSANMPPVQSQGRQGSCVAWAVAYAARSYFSGLGFNSNFKLADGSVNNETVLSPAFVYNQIKAGDCLKGSYVHDALNLLKNQGVCTWKDMPYTDQECDTQPGTQQVAGAAKYKIADWGRVLITTDAIKKFLYYDMPVVIAGRLNADFKKPTRFPDGQFVWKDATPNDVSYHAMIIVGYDDARKAFKIQNSWGKKWRNDGYIWMSYDIVKDVIREAYVMTSDELLLRSQASVETGSAVKYEQNVVGYTGRIMQLGDLPVIGYGVCLATTPSLPTSKYYAKAQNIPATPFEFSVNESINTNKIWYRAFVETVAGVVYGDTASIVLNSGPGETRDKDLILFHSGFFGYAVDAGTGERLWEAPLRNGAASDQLLGGLIVNEQYIVPGNMTGSLSAVSLSTGKVNWERREMMRSKQTYPVIINNQIITIGREELIAVDQASGNLSWTQKQAAFGAEDFIEFGLAVTKDNKLSVNVNKSFYDDEMYFVSNPSNGTGIAGTGIYPTTVKGHPDFADNYMVRSEAMSGLAAYSLSPFKKLWSTPSTTMAAHDSPLIVGSRVIGVMTSNLVQGLQAVDKATGKKLWEYYPQQGEVLSKKWSASADFIATIVRVNMGDASNYEYSLHVLDISTGKVSWTKKLSTSPYPVIPMYPLIAGDKVYVSPDNLDIAAFKLQTGAVIWQKKLFSYPGTISPFSLITKEGKIFYMPESGM
ncbi:MAG: PQQ-binding-like beta-propeller repeat protein [Dyadobacter fermentans]